MRPNNRQRPRGGRGGGGGGGGGGGHHHHKQHHNNNPNRPPNRNQIFDSSGPDVRVRGNAHQVFDKYQALAREANSSGDRILAEAYWQYAEHYFRMIQQMGGFVPRNNWGDGGEEGQQPPQQQQGQNGQPPQANGGNGAPQGERMSGERNGGERHGGDRNGGPPPGDVPEADSDPGLGGVAFLQSGRGGGQSSRDPAADEQPEVPEFPTTGRR